MMQDIYILNKIDRYKRLITILFVISCSLCIFTGCLIVKEKDKIIKKETVSAYEMSQKSLIKMSSQFVRSATGDMIAALPDGWFFIEPEGGISSDVFAIAVNPEYTISAVFSHLKKTSEISEIVNKEGLIGLAHLCFLKHNIKSSNSTTLDGNYQLLDVKPQKFGFFSYIKSKDNTFGSSVTFVSSIDEYYEFSLVTMNFTPNDLPNRIEFDRIFQSILATLKY